MILFNLYNSNTNFYGRQPKYTKQFLDKTLTPFINSQTPLKDIVNITKIDKLTIRQWVKNKYEKGIGKLYREKMLEQLKSELLSLIAEGMSLKDIAQKFNRSENWLLDFCSYYKIKIPTSHAKEKIRHNKIRQTKCAKKADYIKQLIEEGYTLKAISEKIHISILSVSNWIKDTYNKNIIDLRKEKQIKLKHNQNTKFHETEELLKKYIIDEGLTIAVAAKKMNKHRSNVSDLMRYHNIMSKKQLAVARLKENLPELIKSGLTLSEMSKKTGVPTETIRHLIKAKYGKTYTQLKKEEIFMKLNNAAEMLNL